VKFSTTAIRRLWSRDITAPKELQLALDIASEKGCKTIAIVKKNTILVASVKNETIITCMDLNKMQNNIVTNIDGVVFL
jgi:flagellar operon protein